MKKIAITGGVSSGKSTVCRLFKDLGSYVVSADEIVHNLLASDPVIKQKTIDLLGSDILINNQLNRKAIAEKVFSNPNKLKSLELILHPTVLHEIELQYQAVKNNPKYNLFIAEIPLLCEVECESLFDFIVVVLAEEKICKERFEKIKQQDSKDFSKRMLRQMPPEEKAAKAHFLLFNNEGLEELKNNVAELTTKIVQSNCKKEIL